MEPGSLPPIGLPSDTEFLWLILSLLVTTRPRHDPFNEKPPIRCTIVLFFVACLPITVQDYRVTTWHLDGVLST